MTSPASKAGQRLLSRLEKEIQRQDPSTAAVGGITKVGNDLEALLKVALAEILAASGTSVKAELQRRRLNPGAGTYARLLGETSPRDANDPLVRTLVADTRRGRSSCVRTFIGEVRNKNNHPGPGPASPKRSMRALAALVRPFLD